ncbi:hypothetical protein [Morganella morganii]|uniref:hypothetical protein n=1 Tax=Morganella morganii TaxID=582 RepID=UPI001BDB3674|nr:hypothetical protein [Morganella morganii]MBT0385738.1 hypothetical protein [Morganella morganii subsp. morganii]
MFNPELKPLQPASPGNARLTIRNWDGAGENVTLTIQRNQDRNYLNDEGHWVGNAFEHRLSLTPDGDNYQIDLDKQFVDPLVTNIQMAYRLTLRDDEGNQDIGTLKINSGVQSSQALGHQEAIKSGAVLSSTAPVAAAAEPAPEPEPAEQEEPEILPDDLTAEPEILQAAPADAPAKKKKSPAGIIIAVILLLAVAGALVWFFVLKDKIAETPPVPPVPAEQIKPAEEPPAAEPEPQKEPAPEEPAVTEPKPDPEPAPADPAPVAAGVEGACSTENMKTGNALAFVQGCLKSHPTDPAILSTIEAAVANKQCDVAQRLYAYKAQAGDAKIAFKYAQEYDPDVKTPGECFSADKETAVYWYEAAVRSDPQNTEAKARLDALKK